MYQDTRRPQSLLVMVIAIGCGLAASLFVARMVQQPANTIQQQVFGPGEADLVVKTSADDLIAGVIAPGQYVDVLVPDEPPRDGKKAYRVLLEQIQVVGGPAPANLPGGAPPQPSEVTLRLTKQQVEELKPFQEKGTLRFIARQPAEKK